MFWQLPICFISASAKLKKDSHKMAFLILRKANMLRGEDMGEQEMIPSEATFSIHETQQNDQQSKCNSDCSSKRMHHPTLINLLLGYKWLACCCINLCQGCLCANLSSSLTFELLLLLYIGQQAWSWAFSAFYYFTLVP